MPQQSDEYEGFETDSAFIAGWTAWAKAHNEAREQANRLPSSKEKPNQPRLTAYPMTREAFLEGVEKLHAAKLIAGDVHVLPDKDNE